MDTRCPSDLSLDETGKPVATSLSSSPLTAFGLMAERHWREFLPKMVAALEAKHRLHEALLDAEEATNRELDLIRRQLIQRGLTPQQAHDSAWETVRERYIFLPPES